MFLSKIWFILVGLLASVAMTAAFVAPRPADRRIEELEGQRLDRAQYAAEQMLKTDAHRWIDYVAKVGRDAVITEALDSATRGAGEGRVVQETVKNRLKALVPDLDAIGVDAIIAADGKGRVVARVGDKEGEAGDGIAGLEVVADALRGYLSDDVWGAGGQIQRVAAAPVLSKTRDRIVGVLVVGADTGKRLAELWKKNLGVDVAVLLRKQVVASTVSEALLSNLPDLVDERLGEIEQAKRTRPIVMPAGSDRLLAVAAPFAGSASEQNAYYVLLGKKAPASDPWALLSSTTADDLKWGNFPWLGLAGGLVVILGVGLFLQRHEMEGPLRRLRGEVQKLARGEVQKVDDTRYAGNFGGIARDVNAAMERFTMAPAPRSETGKKDLNAILDSGEETDGKTFDLGSHFGTPPVLSPPAGMLSSNAPPPPPPSLLGGAGGLSRGPVSALGAVPVERLSSPPLGGPPPLLGVARPAPPPPGGLPKAPTPMPLFTAPPTPPQPVPLQPPAPAVLFTNGVDTAAADEDDAKTRTVEVDAEEAHIREVFAEYINVRKQCGETTSNLALDKFRAKLEANRQQLVAKYGCRTARFSVYVKDGKAAIKATPIRD